MSSIQKQAKKYTKHNLLPISFKMDLENGKKDISKKEGETMMPRGDYTDASQWKNYVLQDKLSSGQHDSLALKTGEKIDGIPRLLVVDVDNKPARRVLRDEIAPPCGNRPGMERFCEEYNYTPHT